MLSIRRVFPSLAATRIRTGPSFAEAIQNVPAPGAERTTMGDYYPLGEYLRGPHDFKVKGCRRG